MAIFLQQVDKRIGPVTRQKAMRVGIHGFGRICFSRGTTLRNISRQVRKKSLAKGDRWAVAT